METTNKALLVIDVQRGLCEGRWAMHDTDRVIERINALTRACRAVQVPVIFVQHDEAEGLVAGSDPWQLAVGLEVEPGDLRLQKQASDAFHRTELHTLLQDRGVTELIVCGMQSDFCVDSTVRRALGLGYAVTLVADAHTTMGDGELSAEQIIGHRNRTLPQLGSYGVPVVALDAALVCQRLVADADPAGAGQGHCGHG